MLVRAEGGPELAATILGDELMGWESCVTGGVEVYQVPGDHLSVFRDENLDCLVQIFRSSSERCLRTPELASARG